jgi:endonuclease/exonuclease/phosphatase family metal-dependent hydrolase
MKARNRHLTIGTYNIHSGIGADGRLNPERIAQVLQEIDADVVALQEVEHHPVNSGDMLDYLAAKTGLTAIAGPTLQRETRHYGNALLTRLSILSLDQIDLSLPRHEPRGAIHATLDWHGKRLQVVATHLGLRPGERRQQVRRLLALFETSTAETSVLLGDINEWLLWGRPLRWLHWYFEPTPSLRTFPARFPVFALDMIRVHPRAALTNIETHDTPLARLASDHLPLKAQLASAV